MPWYPSAITVMFKGISTAVCWSTAYFTQIFHTPNWMICTAVIQIQSIRLQPILAHPMIPQQQHHVQNFMVTALPEFGSEHKINRLVMEKNHTWDGIQLIIHSDQWDFAREHSTILTEDSQYWPTVSSPVKKKTETVNSLTPSMIFFYLNASLW